MHMYVCVYMYHSFISFYIYTRTRRLLAPSNDANALFVCPPHATTTINRILCVTRLSYVDSLSLRPLSLPVSLCHTAVTVTKVNDFLQALLLSSVALPRSSSLSLSQNKQRQQTFLPSLVLLSSSSLLLPPRAAHTYVCVYDVWAGRAQSEWPRRRRS